MRRQHKLFLSLLPFTCLAASLHIAAQDTTKPTAEPHEATTVIKTSAQLVVVDVVVQDSNGNPIHGLTADNFHISENKNQQTVRQFEEHRSVPSNPAQGQLNLPLGTFTDFTPVRPDAPLNILLLDTINTPTTDQSFLRSQLREYVKHADPNTRTAVIAMASDKLIMLQSFTTDPRILKYVIENKLDLKSSTFLNDRSLQDTREDVEQKLEDTALNTSGGIDPAVATSQSATANLLHQLQSLAETQSFQMKLRMNETLETMGQLARYLSSFPGRKNLIWFSGSFPLSILPDPTIPNPFAVIAGSDDEYRQMTNLFARAQVAVYPIDARGLMGPDMVDASRPGKANDRSARAVSAALSKSFADRTDEHTTMDKMADDTGGHSAYNVNNLSDAVKAAIDTGANYYTIAYSPTDHSWDNRFRAIRVDMDGPAAGRHLKLTYRHGYYADDPAAKPDKNTAAVAQASTANTGSFSHMRAALSYGAPGPADIVFKVKVLPATTATEANVAPNNSVAPTAKGPYRRYSVDYAAITRTFAWKTDADGQMECSAELGALVYDREGHLLNSMSQPFHYKLSAADYNLLTQQGMQLHLEVSAPAKSDSYLRLAIHDFNDDKFGVVEVPTSVVEKLPPAL